MTIRLACLSVLCLQLACSNTTDVATQHGCANIEFPDHAQSAYVLPYAVGSSFTVLQGNCTSHKRTHYTGSTLQFAFDFAMPIGTEVLAARAGVVRRTINSYTDAHRQSGEENLVVISHDDGTFGVYMHFTQQGVNVREGQYVQQYQVLGRSGNSGLSSEPHLHFHVLEVSKPSNCDIRLPTCIIQCNQSDTQCYSIPVSFRNTVSQRYGLLEQQSYPALAPANDGWQTPPRQVLPGK